MGNTNTTCCGKDIDLKEQENFLQLTDRTNEIPLQEPLEKFEFSYENILKYITTSYENNYLEKLSISEKLEEFCLEPEEIENAEKLNAKETVLLIHQNLGDFKTKKYVLKVLKFSYDNARVTEADIKKRCPLQYLENKNILKELRITRNHSNMFLSKCRGFYLDHLKCNLYFVYDHYEHSIEKFIKENSLDFVNKIRIMKAIIELIKKLHTSGIISLDLSINSLRFTSKKFNLKLVSFGNSFDMKSMYDIDRNTTLDRSKANVHYPPEIVLKEINKINWHCDIWSFGVVIAMLFSKKIFDISFEKLSECYNKEKLPEEMYANIDNVYIKSFVVGILRISNIERPTVFEIIDVYNDLVREFKYSDEYLIAYSKDEVLEFTRIFQKSTHVLLNEEVNLIRGEEENNHPNYYEGHTNINNLVNE